jgi:hypothetical protein
MATHRTTPPAHSPGRDSRAGGGSDKKGGYPSGQPASPRPPKPPTSGGPGTSPSKPTGS